MTSKARSSWNQRAHGKQTDTLLTLRSFPLVLLVVSALLGHPRAWAQPDGANNRLDYQQQFATAVRAAADLHWPAIVTVESIGAEEVKGKEVLQDAPTSGVVVDPGGYVLTSDLIAKSASTSILVRMQDGTRYAAQMVARDRHRNLALLKVEAKAPLPSLSWGKFSTPSTGDEDPSNRFSPSWTVGQTTVAVGRYGSGGDPLLSTGILSAYDRLEGIALQTDARISPSFYGGLLIDLNAGPMGVIVPGVAAGGAEDETSWYDAGIAFAIPLDVIGRKIERLKAGQEIQKGLIGIVAKSKDPYESDTTIAAVRLRSPAENAGLKAGDVLVRVAGRKVTRYQQIKEALGPHDAGEGIEIEWKRDGEPMSAEVILADTIPPLDPQWLGILAATSGSDESSSLQVVDVLPDSPAADQLRPGDEILEIGAAKSPDSSTLRRSVLTADPDGAIRLLIRRNEKTPEVSGTTDPVELSLKSVSIAKAWRTDYPAAWTKSVEKRTDNSEEPRADSDKVGGNAAAKGEKSWKIQAMKLPDAANQGAILLPNEDDADNATLGLFVAICPPDVRDPESRLERWRESCAKAGVAICAIASEHEQGWQPKEIEVVGRFATLAMKRAGIHEMAVAVGSISGALSGKSSAADSMAVAVAMTESNRFHGLITTLETRAPAIRLKENDPQTPLQVLIAADEESELPPWIGQLKLGGYPVVKGQSIQQEPLLRWIRLLQTI